MEVYSRVRKKIQSWIFTDEFDQKYRNSATKDIFIMYCLCGGFCFDENVRKSFRKFWINYNIFNFVMVYYWCIFYLINVPVKDYYSMLLPAPIMGGLLLKIAFYLWILKTKDAFSKLFDFLDRKSLILESQCQSSQATSSTSVNNDQKKSVNSFVIVVLSICIIACCQNFENYVKFDDYVIMLYPVYAPFEKTVLIRFVIRVIQIANVLPLFTIAVTALLLLFTTIRNIYDKFVFLSFFIQDASESLTRSIDEIWMLETAMEDKYIPSSLSKVQELKIKKALAMDEFVGKMIVVIKQHQELHSMAKIYANELNFIFSLIYVQVMATETVYAFLISSIAEKTQFYQSFLVLLVLCGVLLVWLLYCFIGEMFQNMNKMVAVEIYNSPWYHLEPKDRRLVFTFMTIIQRPIAIVICNSYPLGLFLFPDSVNTIYSQVQILRTLQFNRQKQRG